MHVADTFIQSDVHCIQGVHYKCMRFPGNRIHNIGVVSTKQALLFALQTLPYIILVVAIWADVINPIPY